MSPGLAKFAFVVILVSNWIVWSHSRYGHISSSPTPLATRGHSVRRSLALELVNSTHHEDECRPIAVPLDGQCSLVTHTCPTSTTFLSIPYLQSYFCSSLPARPFVFVGLILWLVFLFSMLGISASDFFCPNLATLAQLLGLDENVAGVTFLAFGNGSPDVFATFSAMRTNSGSLAIGELLGAASFIVSCVVGSMCIIKPFKVNPGPFLRDIGFFTIAVAMFLFILMDGSIRAWEAGLLIALYLVYVCAVVVGSWWDRRQERIRARDAQIRNQFASEETPEVPYHDEEPYRDEPIQRDGRSTLQVPEQYTRVQATSHPGPPRLELRTELPPRSRSRSRSPSPVTSHLPSFSLVGALEFRQVISSLQNQAAGSSLSVFESPLTPYPGGHYHSHRHSWSRPRTPLSTHEGENLFDISYGVPLDDRSPRLATPRALPPDAVSSRSITPLIALDDGQGVSVPLISHTPASPTASPTSDVDSEAPTAAAPRRQHLFHVLGRTFHILFPTLHGLRSKTTLGKIAAVFAAPAVFVLTLTLPVMVTPYDSGHFHLEKPGTDERLIAFEESGIERALIAEEIVEDELHELRFNKWLMAAQCTFGPLFCVAVLFKNTQHEGWLLLATGIAGIAGGTLVAIFAENGDHPTTSMARCSMGFFVAMVWIMAIADEVVYVLQTFGFIFGLSDAIIGLTIFAIGNSLADLVANMSVAVFAPVMGFSACFGGPMLNMLLGVGISGSYIIRQTGESYELEFSNTLFVSAIGLLFLLFATMIFIPLNGYHLPRSWGFFLVFSYTVIMVINIIVEVAGLRHKSK